MIVIICEKTSIYHIRIDTFIKSFLEIISDIRFKNKFYFLTGKEKMSL